MLLLLSDIDDFCLIECKSWIGEWLLLKHVWIHFINVCTWLYVDWVWIGVIVYEVWIKNEKKWGVLVKNEHSDNFGENWYYDSMFLVVSIVFWYTLTNVKVLGSSLASRGSKLGILDENWVSSREEPKIWVPLCWWTRCSDWSLAIASCSVQQLMILAFRVLWGRSGLSKLIILMYLNVFKLSKPLETSNELDWT